MYTVLRRKSFNSLLFFHSMKRNLEQTSSNKCLKLKHTMPDSDVKEVKTLLEPPIKSENDKKDYRVMKLGNGLMALLISDSSNGPLPNEDIDSDLQNNEDAMSVAGSEDSADKTSDDDSESDEESEPNSKDKQDTETQSAASLSIKVGSFHDPPDIPGLAHFLEHMVFMGSNKYPQENHFDAFIKKQGGHDNASTDWDTTNFYFLSQPRHLHKALDMFARFFYEPLMKKDAMQREREAIESEFQLALPSDYHRKKQLLCSLARQNHPATKFPWGSMDTLGFNGKKDDELHKMLHDFRETHYVAGGMKLVVQSRHDLDTLEKWVLECFGPIRPGEPVPIVADDEPFRTPRFNKIYHVDPVKDVCQVDLTWAFPSYLSKYKYKPDRYISWLLGHEGKGSLLSYLREKVWALELYCGSDDSGSDHNSLYMQFAASITLTDQGVQNIEQVIQAVFSYLAMLREVGPQQRIFDEIQAISDMRFKFATEASVSDNVESLADNMQKYPPEHYICGSELFFEYSPEEITRYVNMLTPDKVNIMLLNKNSKQVYDQQEKWFSTKFSVENIPENSLSMWQTAKPLPEFHLPLQNPYIATNFNFLPCEDPSEYPKKVFCNDRGELWFKQDYKIKLPRSYFYFQLISPLPALSPTNAVLMDLLASILVLQLNTEVYQAELAELSYSLFPSVEGKACGLGLRLHGFSQQLPLLLEAIIKQFLLFEQDLKTPMFEAVKDKQKKSYYNTFLKPGKLHKDINSSLVRTNHWMALDRHAAIDSVTVEHLVQFSKELKSRMYIKALMQGNLTEDQAKTIMTKTVGTLNHQPILSNTWPQLRFAQLEVGSCICRVSSFNLESTNSIVSHSFHCGLASMQNTCISELVMLMLEENAFDTLRTKEQLGYDVTCEDSITRGVLVFYVTVACQQDKHTIEYVDGRISHLLENFQVILEKLSSLELEELRQSAMKSKLQIDLKLSEEVDRNWTEITTEEFMFDRRHKEHEVLSKISHKDMMEWFRQVVFDTSKTTRHLVLQVKGVLPPHNEKTPIETTTESVEITSADVSGKSCASSILQFLPVPESNSRKVITNIEGYRKSLFLYPAHNVEN